MFPDISFFANHSGLLIAFFGLLYKQRIFSRQAISISARISSMQLGMWVMSIKTTLNSCISVCINRQHPFFCAIVGFCDNFRVFICFKDSKTQKAIFLMRKFALLREFTLLYFSTWFQSNVIYIGIQSMQIDTT